MKTLKEVLKLLNIDSNNENEVSGISSDSRKVRNGFIFVALNGLHNKGSKYIKNAFENGAIAVFNEEIEGENIYKVENLKEKISELGKFIYELDFDKFKVIGITGTNGKTTTTSLIHKSLLNKNINASLIGTNGVFYNNEHHETNNTTPNLLEIYEIFYESKQRNIDTIIMEVSSHAIAQERIKNIKFDIIGFTNISHDHLDFHKTIENYAKSKYKLVDYLKKDGTIIYNADDEWFGEKFSFAGFNSIGFGINKGTQRIENIRLTNNKSYFFIQKNYFESSLTCQFNVYNLALAYLCLLKIGLKYSQIKDCFLKVKSIDGRMQKIEINNRFIYIDFAHSPDSIEKVLSFVKPLNKRKMIVIFGAGGDRDKTKRPKMLDVCSKYCDKIYVTSDNPRYEEPKKIIDDIVKNKMSYKINVFLSREDAIKDAFKYSNEFDTILLLGKGNEQYQIINDIKIPYSDNEVINRCLLNSEDSFI
ncbi:MAG: UDP-N-acetylmuramoyl-L-alanyl-D-glutamate--2,6-diaminopimelate ligase [Bacilli bacterium]|nr:UDP-N-acetylmuramoyl-L-alanyl-D-glutamate--2,6-diaminopimelate ligase [Bacilli bacterium]